MMINDINCLKTDLITMILTVAATEFEMKPTLAGLTDVNCHALVCGVGPVESCLNLTRYLEKNHSSISTVVNVGIAGAFHQKNSDAPALLDICLAKTEVFGDFGICFPLRIDDLSADLAERCFFELDSTLLQDAKKILNELEIRHFTGDFVTVNCVSGTAVRGDLLYRKFNGLCENMEGASLARVCEEFSLPMLEVRSISNYVEDRDPSRWAIAEACEEGGKAAASIIRQLGR